MAASLNLAAQPEYFSMTVHLALNAVLRSCRSTAEGLARTIHEASAPGSCEHGLSVVG